MAAARRAQASLELAGIARSWLQPRFPLVNALLVELIRLDRGGDSQLLSRPPRVHRRLPLKRRS